MNNYSRFYTIDLSELLMIPLIYNLFADALTRPPTTHPLVLDFSVLPMKFYHFPFPSDAQMVFDYSISPLSSAYSFLFQTLALFPPTIPLHVVQFC